MNILNNNKIPGEILGFILNNIFYLYCFYPITLVLDELCLNTEPSFHY